MRACPGGSEIVEKTPEEVVQGRWLNVSNQLRHYQMKRFFAGLMYHVLIELLSQLLICITEWAEAAP